MVQIYFLFVRLAAFFGHRKARLLVHGQAQTLRELAQQNPFYPRTDHRPLLWFHAASVGEFEQVRPLIERLRAEQKNVYIILTFFSPSGYEMRKNYDKADKVYYLPFATRKNAQRFLDALRPDIAVFAKYEFWPAYLKALKSRKIPTYIVSAIFRERQLFFLPWGKFYRNLLHCFTHLYVQDNVSRDLLLRHGIEHVSIAGDTRFDRVLAAAEQHRQIEKVEAFIQDPVVYSPLGNLSSTPSVIVAGSTWPEDEKLLARYIAERPQVKLILVPHEINEEHLAKIFQMFEGRYVRFTQATQQNIDTCRVLVVDTMGLLLHLYRYATVAYVGGGFGVGIHNTLEAAVYGIPVIFGSNYYKFREAKGLIAAGAARSVKNTEELTEALDNALANHAQLGQLARDYVQQESGATEKIYNDLFQNLA